MGFKSYGWFHVGKEFINKARTKWRRCVNSPGDSAGQPCGNRWPNAAAVPFPVALPYCTTSQCSFDGTPLEDAALVSARIKRASKTRHGWIINEEGCECDEDRRNAPAIRQRRNMTEGCKANFSYKPAEFFIISPVTTFCLQRKVYVAECILYNIFASKWAKTEHFRRPFKTVPQTHKNQQKQLKSLLNKL